jgi:hypothetical protein
MSRLRDQVERALGALLVARLGRADCEELQSVLEGWDGTFSPVWRKRVARHVDRCDLCTEKRKGLLSPLSLLAAAPLVPAPLALRSSTLDKVRHISNVRPAGGWRRASARGGFPPSMFDERRRRLLLAAAAAALFLVPAVIVAEPWGRGGGEPEVASARRDVTTTTQQPITTTIPPTAATTTDSAPAVAPPPDTTGPALSATQQGDCFVSYLSSNTITASASDGSGVEAVVLTASGSSMTSPASQAMSPGGGGAYSAAVSWNGGGQYSWTVTATDSTGNSTSRAGSFVVQTDC